MNSPGSPHVIAYCSTFRAVPLEYRSEVAASSNRTFYLPVIIDRARYDGRRSLRKGCWSALSQRERPIPLAPLQAAAEARQKVHETEVRPRTLRIQNNLVGPCLRIPGPTLTPDAVRRCEVTTFMANS